MSEDANRTRKTNQREAGFQSRDPPLHQWRRRSPAQWRPRSRCCGWLRSRLGRRRGRGGGCTRSSRWVSSTACARRGSPAESTTLLSCTSDQFTSYRGLRLGHTLQVPSYSRHPRTGDWYPAIIKPAGVVHWLKHSQEADNVDWAVIFDADQIVRDPIIPWELGAEKGTLQSINQQQFSIGLQTDAEFTVILDADMIMRGPITPWEYGAKLGHPVSTPDEYLIGCDNILAKIHTRNPSACDKVGRVIITRIDDLRRFAMLWPHKTEEVRADKGHYATNITGDICGSGWISEMYG